MAPRLIGRRGHRGRHMVDSDSDTTAVEAVQSNLFSNVYEYKAHTMVALFEAIMRWQRPGVGHSHGHAVECTQSGRSRVDLMGPFRSKACVARQRSSMKPTCVA
jgi:hypothetical protein